jgi:hypothetical protein
MLSHKTSPGERTSSFEGVKIGTDGSMEPIEDSKQLDLESKIKKSNMKSIQVN